MSGSDVGRVGSGGVGGAVSGGGCGGGGVVGSVSSVSGGVSVSAVGRVASGGQRPSKVGLRDVVADPGHHRQVFRGGSSVWGHNPHCRLPA